MTRPGAWRRGRHMQTKSTSCVQAAHSQAEVLSPGITHVKLVGDPDTPVAKARCVIQSGSPTNLMPQETPE